MKKVTNRCQACGKRYKLPTILDKPEREYYCVTCGVIHDYIQVVLDTIAATYKVDGLAVWEAVRTIDEQANLLKEINENTSNTKG